MATVFLAPMNKIIEVKVGQSLMAAIKDAGIYLRASCGGHASCGDCVVKVVEGGEHLATMEFAEQRLLGNVYHITKERLSCQCFLEDQFHLAIDLSAHNQQTDQAQSTKMVKRRPGAGGGSSGGRGGEKRSERPASSDRAGGGRRPRMFETPERNETKTETKNEIRITQRPTTSPSTPASVIEKPPKFPRKKFRS